MQEIVDMPDKLIDLFIRLLIQNNGKLSSTKREKYFYFLTTDELKELIDVVVANMLPNTKNT